MASNKIDNPRSQGRNGARMRAAAAAPAAARNVPAGKQQLMAVTRPPIAARDDTATPRDWLMGRFLHTRTGRELPLMHYNKVVASDARLDQAVSRLNEVRY